MADITFDGMTLTGDHASRPAATAVGKGTLYACSTHSLVYQSDAASWSTWATLGSVGGSITVDGDTGDGPVSSVDTIVFDGATITDDTGGQVTVSGLGGGSVTPTYLGYDTIGGTQENTTNNRFIGKSFTPAADCLLMGIEVYCRESGDGLSTPMVALHANNAGALGTILAIGYGGVIAFTNNSTFANNDTVSVPRWLNIPIMYKLTGGTTYWGGVFIFDTTAPMTMYYDSSGTDRRYDSGGDFVADGGRYTQTDTTRKYSIRFLTI